MSLASSAIEGTATAIDWDDDTFERALRRLETEGTIYAVRVHIDSEQRERILQAAPRDPDHEGRPMLRGADFSGATFGNDANFAEAHFSGDAGFWGAQFSGDADFDGAQFSGDAGFWGAQFSGANFAGGAVLRPRRLRRGAVLRPRRLPRGAVLRPRRLRRRRVLQRRRLQTRRRRVLRRRRLRRGTVLRRRRLRRGAVLRRRRLQPDDFKRVRLGPIVVAGTLCFEETAFDEEVQLNVAVAKLACRGTRFGGRADLNVRWAEVALDEATFVARSRLAGVGPFPNIDDSPARACRVDRCLDAQERPRLLSVRGANVENLALGNVDLRACRFFGAHGLDQMRIEADCDFAEPPPRWWYTRRRTLAEEHHWHARRSVDGAGARTDREPRPASNPSDRRDPRDWHPPECQPAAWLEQTTEAQILDPPRIASLYRLLRKALEDRKDEPGAADFYYGEMEMRRLRRPAGHRPTGRASRDRGERALLALYWLVSGYGLRASRALIAGMITVAVGALLLDLGGFDPGKYPDVGTGWFAIESSISLMRAPDTGNLTALGRGVHFALRLAGPLFFGLALLALRGRVKR